MNEPEIKFESLRLHRQFDDTIKGSLKIKSDDGSSVEITLPEQYLESLVDSVAGELAEAANLQAGRLRDAILRRGGVSGEDK